MVSSNSKYVVTVTLEKSKRFDFNSIKHKKLGLALQLPACVVYLCVSLSVSDQSDNVFPQKSFIALSYGLNVS